MQYRVSSLNNLQIITDHLDSYPLITPKSADYLLFKQAIAIINNKEHFSREGLLKLVGIKATLNWGLSDKFKESFPQVFFGINSKKKTRKTSSKTFSNI